MLRKSKFDQTQIFQWDNGDLFNGGAIIAMTIPTVNGTSATPWLSINLGDTWYKLSLPLNFAFVPIKDGKISDALGLFYNEDITPPNTQYIHYIVDATRKIIAGPGTVFTVNSDITTLPTLVLPEPEIPGSIIPVPA
jgi:hypothetical protein